MRNVKSRSLLDIEVASTPHLACPVQVIVIDKENGPAEILMDTVSRLADAEVSILHYADTGDALKKLEQHKFDLLVIGVDRYSTADTLSVMPYVRVQHPELNVIVIGKRVTKADRACAEHFKVQDIINMPTRACKMKSLVSYLAHRYF